jgi:peptidoglycan/xylan/chitin deacetylase (PgdA/CDA1 family)
LKDRASKLLSLFVNHFPGALAKKICGEITPIFMLHRLSSQDTLKQEQELKHLEWCLQYVKDNGYKPISLKQLGESFKNGLPVPAKSVVFTLDDGFFDQFELAAPLFNRFQIPYTCFVITDFLDGKLWPWDDQISYILERTKNPIIDTHFPNGEKLYLELEKFDNISKAIDITRHKIKKSPQENLYPWLSTFYQAANVEQPIAAPDIHRPMSWEQAQQLIDDGHDIAPHTMTHRILSQLSDREAEMEILGSFARVNEKLTGASSTFAYPTGRPEDYTEREKAILRQAGSILSVNTTANYTSSNHNIFEQPRFPLPKNKFDFIQYLSFFDKFKRVTLAKRYAS